MTWGFQHKVVDLVCDIMDVDRKCLFVPDRRRNVVIARHLCMYIMKERFGVTLTDIGRFFTKNSVPMHHTSVIHACRTIQDGLDIKQKEIVVPYTQTMNRLDKLLAKRAKNPNILVIKYSPLTDVDRVIELLKRNFNDLEIEKT